MLWIMWSCWVFNSFEDSFIKFYSCCICILYVKKIIRIKIVPSEKCKDSIKSIAKMIKIIIKLWVDLGFGATSWKIWDSICFITEKISLNHLFKRDSVVPNNTKRVINNKQGDYLGIFFFWVGRKDINQLIQIRFMYVWMLRLFSISPVSLN